MNIYRVKMTEHRFNIWSTEFHFTNLPTESDVLSAVKAEAPVAGPEYSTFYNDLEEATHLFLWEDALEPGMAEVGNLAGDKIYIRLAVVKLTDNSGN